MLVTDDLGYSVVVTSGSNSRKNYVFLSKQPSNRPIPCAFFSLSLLLCQKYVLAKRSLGTLFYFNSNVPVGADILRWSTLELSKWSKWPFEYFCYIFWNIQMVKIVYYKNIQIVKNSVFKVYFWKLEWFFVKCINKSLRSLLYHKDFLFPLLSHLWLISRFNYCSMVIVFDGCLSLYSRNIFAIFRQIFRTTVTVNSVLYTIVYMSENDTHWTDTKIISIARERFVRMYVRVGSIRIGSH